VANTAEVVPSANTSVKNISTRIIAEPRSRSATVARRARRI
jgi:hypothetical protein